MLKAYEYFSLIVNKLTKAALWIAAVAVGLSCVLIVVEIVMRNLFNSTTGISVEYSTYLLVLMVFAALAYTQKAGSMIYLEITYDRFSPRWQRYLNALRWTLGVVYGAAATWYLYHFTAATCSLGQVSMFPSRTPLCGPQSFMVIGTALLTLEYLRGAIAACYEAVTGDALIAFRKSEGHF